MDTPQTPQTPPANEPYIAYRNSLIAAIGKSQDALDKQISFISAGAIGVGLTLITKVEHASKFAVFITAILFEVLSLVINLLSHIYAVSCHQKTIREINNKTYDKQKVRKRNGTIKWMNIVTVLLLVGGIALLAIFILCNIQNFNYASKTA